MAEYHISTTGSDLADGSLATPWRNISKAHKAPVAAGDIIYIHSGTYSEIISSDAFTPVCGAPTNLITIINYENDSVTLNGRIRAYGTGSSLCTNYKYQGFTIIEGINGQSGYRMTGDNTTGVLEFVDMEIYSCSNSSIYLGYTNQNMGIIRIYGGKYHNSSGGDETSGILFGGHAEVNISGAECYGNQNKGINFRNEVGTTGSIKYCNIHDNVESGLDWPGQFSELSYNTCSNNGILDTEVDEWGDKNFGFQSSATGNIVHHNLISNSGRYGVTFMSSGNTFYNNTIIDNTPYPVESSQSDRALIIFYNGGQNNIVKNNILVNNIPNHGNEDTDIFLCMLATSLTVYQSNDIDNNNYYTANHPQSKIIKTAGDNTYTLAEWQTAKGTDMNSIQQDPDFAETTSYTLNVASLSIDLGTTAIGNGITITEYNGLAPDAGYWEYPITETTINIDILCRFRT